MSSKLDIEIFKNKYPFDTYSHTVVKSILNDMYRMELTQEEVAFLKELNMISGDDFEANDLRNQYLEQGIKNFFSQASKETVNEMQEYMYKQTELSKNQSPNRLKNQEYFK